MALVAKLPKEQYTNVELPIEEKWVSIPLGGVSMEKIDLPFFYQLGAVLKPLTEMEAKDSTRVDIWLASFHVGENVRDLLDLFSTLTVCRGAGKELISVIEEAGNWMRQTPAQEWHKQDYSVDLKFRRIISKAKEFETVLSAELQTLATYHATQKGIYSTTDLIERAENTLPASVLPKISQGVKEEIRQSGRCLAFDSGTACAFHIMRATEAVMHEYYIFVRKPKPKPKEKLDSWGAYIAELQKSQKPEVKEVVAMLQQVKDRHRNLIMHPEVILTPDEAFTLFEIAQGAIIAMAIKLPTRKKKKA